jgi:RHS repeat-associated protein
LLLGAAASPTITPGVTYKEYKDYDLDGRMTIYEFRNGTSILKNTIAWDQASRITTLTDNVTSANSKVFAYDGLDRLTAMSAASGVTTTQPNYSFAYDLLSNRTSMGVTPPGQAAQNTTYAYGATNQRLNTLTAPVAANDKTYTYDLAGNVLADGAAATNYTFTYDAKNRMKTVSWTGGSTNVTQTQTYVYNGMGQGVRKVKTAGTGTATATSTIAQPTANYSYDEAGQITGEYNANNQLIQEIIWLGDVPLATLRPRAGAGITVGQLTGANVQVMDQFYIHADHLNTPRAITRPSDNKLVWRWDNTEAFGNNTPNENPQVVGTFKFNLRFPGQQFDAETNLHYNYFRDYNPATGRYVQSDPIGLEGGLNTYGYVGANPLALMDPLGLMTSVEARVMVLLGQGNLAEAIVIAEAAGLAIAPRLAQTQTAMQNLINKFPLQTNQCEKLASGLSDAFKSMQANPQIFRVEPTATRFIRIGVEGSYSPTNHVFVRVGNTIFDASTGAQGVPYTQYITMLNQINQGPGSYVIKRFKVK